MATVTGMTAARMLVIENNSIVSGAIVGNNLILTKHGGATVDAGNVRGPTGLPGVDNATFNAGMAAAGPVGMICDYVGSTAPTGWLPIFGSVANGQTLYPLLWAVLPASMKSGSTIVFPDTRGRVFVNQNGADTDFDTIGELGGTKTVTLAEANLPPHAHSMVHTHSVDHQHPAAIVRRTSDHGGGGFVTYPIGVNAGGPYPGVQVSGTSLPYLQADIPNYTGNSGASSAATTGGGSGTASAITNVQPYVVMLKIIKAV